MAKKNWLSSIKLREVSLVPDGMNQHAKSILIKQKSDNSEDYDIMNDERFKILKQLAEHLGIGILNKEGDDLIISGDDTMSDEALKKSVDTLTTKVTDLEKQNQNFMVRQTLLVKIASAIDLDSLNKISAEVLAIKANDAEGYDFVNKQFESRKTELENIGKKTARDDLVKEFRGKLPDAIKKGFDDMSEAEQDNFMKAYTGTVDNKDSEISGPLKKVLDQLTQTNETLVKELKDVRGEQEIAKLRTELADLDGIVNLAEFVPTYKGLLDTNPELAKSTLESMRALAVQARKGGNLLRVIGKDGEDETVVTKQGSSTALEKEVKKYMIDHPDVEEAEAFAKVLEANPDLYNDAANEQDAATAGVN